MISYECPMISYDSPRKIKQGRPGAPPLADMHAKNPHETIRLSIAMSQNLQQARSAALGRS